jgi:CRP-like cAMP-binding protein
MLPPEPDAALARVPLLRSAGAEALALAARRATWRQYRPNEVVLDFGDPSDDVFFVVEGEVRVVVRSKLGQEVIFTDLGVGEFFGELAAIDHAPRSASITALVATKLCCIPGQVFLDMVYMSPPLCLALLQTLTDRLRDKSERILELVTLPVRQRLCADLLRLSRPRTGGGRVVSPPPAQHVLAARIGARREAVSRELGELSRQGLVEVSRRAIVLPDPEALAAAVDRGLDSSHHGTV